jgi:hypothetical protein
VSDIRLLEVDALKKREREETVIGGIPLPDLTFVWDMAWEREGRGNKKSGRMMRSLLTYASCLVYEQGGSVHVTGPLCTLFINEFSQQGKHANPNIRTSAHHRHSYALCHLAYSLSYGTYVRKCCDGEENR